MRREDNAVAAVETERIARVSASDAERCWRSALHPETPAPLHTVVTSMSKLADLSKVPDREIVTRAREGGEDACRELVRRHGPAVYERIYRMVGNHELAEDLTQETFAKAFRALDRHGPERKLAAWLSQIGKNTALDYVRLKRPDSTRSHLTKTPGQIDRRGLHMPTPGHTPTARTDAREFAAALRRALRRLRPQYRRCFVLHHFQQRSYAAIARELNLPVSTVGTYLQRARAELKRILGDTWLQATTPQ